MHIVINILRIIHNCCYLPFLFFAVHVDTMFMLTCIFFSTFHLKFYLVFSSFSCSFFSTCIASFYDLTLTLQALAEPNIPALTLNFRGQVYHAVYLQHVQVLNKKLASPPSVSASTAHYHMMYFRSQTQHVLFGMFTSVPYSG